MLFSDRAIAVSAGFVVVLSAASDIPATRFLGQAPGGLNATGDSDLENYYNMIDAMQRQRLMPAILRFYDVIGYQKWPDMWDRIREEIEIVFPPLWNINELDESQKNQLELANVMQAWEAGLMPDEKAIEEINLKKIFSTDLDSKDIDLLKGMQDDSGFYDSPDDNNSTYSKPVASKVGFNGEGQGKGVGAEAKPAVAPIKASEPKKLSLPKIGNKKVKNSVSDPTIYDLEQVLIGMKIEQEHNDLTLGDPVKIAEIVKAHLEEDKDYYTKLEKAGL